MGHGAGLPVGEPAGVDVADRLRAFYGRGCLGSDARDIVILETTYERGRDAMGVPYERNLGTSTRTVRVKASLVGLAMSVQLDDPTFGARLLDYLRARGTLGASDVVASTRTMMRDFACNDRRLLQLEERLVEYIGSRGRR